MGSPEVKESRTPHLYYYGDYVKVCQLKECNTKHTNRKFCSRRCAGIQNMKKGWGWNKKYSLSKHTHCVECNKELTKEQRRESKGKRKFCSRSCNAKASNRGKPCRNGGFKVTRNCPTCKKDFVCGNADSKKYCSRDCQIISITKYHTPEEKLRNKRAKNRIYQLEHYAKYWKGKKITGNRKLMNEIWYRRPDGYDVDHIIPVTRDGEHHEDNLRYMNIDDNRKIKQNRLDSEIDPEVFAKLDIIPWQVILHEYH